MCLLLLIRAYWTWKSIRDCIKDILQKNILRRNGEMPQPFSKELLNRRKWTQYHVGQGHSGKGYLFTQMGNNQQFPQMSIYLNKFAELCRYRLKKPCLALVKIVCAQIIVENKFPLDLGSLTQACSIVKDDE